MIKPDYYDDFKCIAGACQHNCCIGWEIDIDNESLQKYQNTDGDIKRSLQKHIALEPCPHFVLTKDERCPFLNKDNLCELILYGGEEMLCQICSDHPRFYNNIDGITEVGLGLCCEAAAKLILTKTTPLKLIAEDVALTENAFFQERTAIFTILQNRKMPLTERITAALAKMNVTSPISKADWIAVYKSLERLDVTWDRHLDSLTHIREDIPTGMEIMFEQLLCYFVYRHLSGAKDDFLYGERLQFAVLSCYLIANLVHSPTDVLEIARMYSAEIEYSDENVTILLDALQECIPNGVI